MDPLLESARHLLDDGGVGGGVLDRLHLLGFSKVIGVNFGARSDRGRAEWKAANKRTEMWLSLRDWLAGASLPNDELLAAELTGPMFSYDTNHSIVLERKQDMKRRGVPPPDVADALALTFAYPVSTQYEEEEPELAWDLGRNATTGY